MIERRRCAEPDRARPASTRCPDRRARGGGCVRASPPAPARSRAPVSAVPWFRKFRTWDLPRRFCDGDGAAIHRLVARRLSASNESDAKMPPSDRGRAHLPALAQRAGDGRGDRARGLPAGRTPRAVAEDRRDRPECRRRPADTPAAIASSTALRMSLGRGEPPPAAPRALEPRRHVRNEAREQHALAPSRRPARARPAARPAAPRRRTGPASRAAARGIPAARHRSARRGSSPG